MPEGAVKQVLESQSRQFFGKYRGLVADNNDPERRGRLEVQVPQVLGDVKVWALPCVPYAGKNVGFYAMPDKEALVWIEFEAGDPSYPIWTGCLWAKNDIDRADAQPHIKFFRTKKFLLRVDDSKDEIRIENKSGSQILINPSEVTIKGAAVKQLTKTGKKTELTNLSFAVNDKALEVL